MSLEWKVKVRSPLHAHVGLPQKLNGAERFWGLSVPGGICFRVVALFFYLFVCFLFSNEHPNPTGITFIMVECGLDAALRREVDGFLGILGTVHHQRGY